MPTIKIKKFGGLITNADAGDISPENASDDKNFDIDVHGKLKKRQGRKALADSPVSDDNFSGVTYWKIRRIVRILSGLYMGIKGRKNGRIVQVTGLKIPRFSLHPIISAVLLICTIR